MVYEAMRTQPLTRRVDAEVFDSSETLGALAHSGRTGGLNANRPVDDY